MKLFIYCLIFIVTINYLFAKKYTEFISIVSVDKVSLDTKDYGNIGAGYTAGAAGLNWSTAQFAFERYQAKGNGNPLGPGQETQQTVDGEYFAWQQAYTDAPFVDNANTSETALPPVVGKNVLRLTR